jgi:prepilin-type N-terminal cleavage/methylation domain-containing protein
MGDNRQRKKGFTLVEILVTMAIMALLATLIMPVAKTAVKREKEIELRQSLRLIREALDAYKKLADEKKIEVEEDSEGYPPDLETLVKGVEVKGGTSTAGTTAAGGIGRKPATSSSEPKTVKFLRQGSHDGFHRLGTALLPGRAGFGCLGRRKCLRRLYQEQGNGPRRLEIQGLVSPWSGRYGGRLRASP